MNKKPLKNDGRFFICKFVYFTVFFLDSYILANFFLFFMKCEVSQTNDVKNNNREFAYF